MNKLNITKLSLLLLLIGLITSCEKKDEEIDNSANIKHDQKYVVALRTLKTGNSTADYLLTTKDLMSGEISAEGNGLEQIGWRFFTSISGRYLSVGYGDNNIIGYTVDNNSGKLTNYGKMVFERLDMNQSIDDRIMLGIGAPWGGGTDVCTMMIIDTKELKANSVKKLKLSNMALEANEYLWPTSARVIGDKLFLSIYKLSGSDFLTPETDKAWVSVFSYPSLEFIKTIEDDRTGPIGQYGNSKMMVETETGDIYTFSSCSIEAGYDKETKPSGVLRIKSGTTEFDPGYFFNIEETGSEGYEVVFTKYLGNGRVFARVVTKDGVETKWSSLSPSVFGSKYVIIDIFKKTISEISSLPVTSGTRTNNVLYENGKVYTVIHDANNNINIYQIDTQTLKAVKGATVKGLDLAGIFKVEKAQ
ncbi:DUF4374 domain-containing protein [Halosquirtibacter xylanolyticus]|uniref:DUF4374 domain-containing protein n=1 Tax=Halosquirtibacter xylanolyticus TaxID=3374599 RepID=UPI003748FE8A|nr:DUF4374 domain-containing protein [Prolixibacteraceae bacterium]